MAARRKTVFFKVWIVSKKARPRFSARNRGFRRFASLSVVGSGRVFRIAPVRQRCLALKQAGIDEGDIPTEEFAGY